MLQSELSSVSQWFEKLLVRVGLSSVDQRSNNMKVRYYIYIVLSFFDISSNIAEACRTFDLLFKLSSCICDNLPAAQNEQLIAGRFISLNDYARCMPVCILSTWMTSFFGCRSIKRISNDKKQGAKDGKNNDPASERNNGRTLNHCEWIDQN